MTTKRARLGSLFTLFFLGISIGFAVHGAPAGLIAGPAPEARRSVVTGDTTRALRARAVAIDREALAAAAGDQSATGRAVLDLRFFDDIVLRMEVTGRERTSSGGLALVGRIAGLWPSSAVIVDNAGVLSVAVATPLGNYALEGSPATGYVASHVDPRPPLPLHPARKPGHTHDEPTAKQVATAKAARDRPIPAGAQADDGSLIDVMVLYTTGAVAQLGDEAAMNARVDAEIAKLNLIYANSGATQRVRLVHKGPIGVADGTDVNNLFNLGLATPMAPGDRPSLARQLSVLRDAYRADLVSVWGLWSFCGAGSLAFLEDASETVRTLSFLDTRCTGGGSIIFAHELGHNQGLRHDVFVGGGPFATTVTPEGSTLPELIGYQHGFSDTVNRFYSIMAYESCNARFGYPCQQAGLFSNLARTFDNRAFFAGASATATFGDATSDEVRLLNDTRETIAAYRDSSDVPAAGVIAFLDTHFGAVSEHHGTLDIVVGRLGGAGAVSIAYSTVNGSGVGGAVAGTDYTSTSGTLTWADGDLTTRTISVPILPNAVLDGFRRFTVQLTTPTGGATAGGHLLNGATAYVTLVDDEVDPWPPGGAMPAGFTGGWVVAADEGYRSSHSLSTPLMPYGTSDHYYTGEFNEGTVTMRVRNAREPGKTGQLRIHLDTQSVAHVTTVEDWHLVSFPVTAGTHTIRFRYEESVITDPDKANRAWIDDFTLPAPGAPRPPTTVTAVVKDAALEIGFTPGHANGSPITSFTATCMPGNISASGSASPILVTGLANNTAYTCSVTATSALGTGTASGSVSATPVVGTQFTSANAATFHALSAGSFTITSTGAPATFSVTGALPSGVTLSAAGVLSGTPASGTVGTYPVTFTANPAGTTQGFTLTVEKSTQVINWSFPAEIPSGAPYTLVATGGGSGNPVVFAAVSTNQCTTSGTNGTTLDAILRGPCSVNASQAGNADFHAAPTIMRLANFIGSRALVVTGPTSLQYGTEAAFSSQHGTIGAPVTFTSLTPSVCTTSGTVFDVAGGRYLSGHLVMPLAIDTCRIRATVPAHTNYAAAEVTLELVVNKRAQAITMTSATSLAPGQTILAVAGSGASGQPVVLSSSTPATCSVNALNVTGVSSGLCLITANQAGGAFHDPAPTVGKSLNVTAPMTLTTQLHSVTLTDGRVFAFDATQAAIYDPTTDAWTPAAAPPVSHVSGAAVLLADGRVFATGGGTTTAHAQTSLFDPVAGTWSTRASMGTIRTLHTLTRLGDGRVLATGGAPSTSLFTLHDTTEIYDPVANTWAGGPAMGAQRALHSATLFPDGRVLVVGGRGPTNSSHTSTQWYDPVGNTWSSASSLPTVRSHHTATLLPDGALLIVGGFSGVNTASSVLRDATTGLFGADNAYPGRRSHTATLLADGSVFAAGGLVGAGESATTAIYIRATDTWSTGPSLLFARSLHGAARLPDGRVLVFSNGSSEIVTFGMKLLGTQMPQALLGTTYGPYSLATRNAAEPVTYAVTSGALPPGVVLSTGGVVTGTPTQVGSFTATVTATDATSATDTADFGFTVQAAKWSVTPSRNSGGTIFPNTPVEVTHGGTTIIYTNPSLGFSEQVGGTCPGTYTPGAFTAGPITQHCTVVVTFTQVAFAPDAPTITSVVGGAQSATVHFTPGASNGSAITGYAVTCTYNSGSAPTVTGTSSPILVTSLLANFQYRCRVTATNAMGTSPPSAESDPVVANPPTTALTVSRGGAGSAGGRVTSAAAGIDCPGTCTATVLRNAYFSFEATVQPGSIFSGWLGRSCEEGRNDLTTCTTFFTGASATLTANFLATGATTLPSIPSTVSGEELPGAILVYFQGGGAGASPITHFTATCTPVGGGTPVSATGTYPPIIVGGLNAGTSYTCNVFATSALGNGGTSSPTPSITVPTPGHLLAVAVTGPGQGTVSDSVWIYCNPSCTGAYDVGTTLTLTATPEVGSAFSHWSNGTGAAAACSGSTSGTCTVTLAGATSLTAHFRVTTPLVLTVTKNGTGSGGVTSSPAGIDCGAACEATFGPAQSVTLTATPASGSAFTGWSGACTGTAGCTVTIDAAKSVTATFSDALAPDTTLLTSPAAITNTTSATFTFSGSDAGSGVASFECRLDAAAFAACVSPASFTPLAPGAHTFDVRAIDVAGNVDATPASHAWTIDASVPTLAFTQKPPITGANQAAYILIGSCTEEGRTVNVQIGSIATSSVCAAGTFTTPAVNVSALPQGPVSLTAGTTDAAGNSGSVTDGTTKDTAAPALTIGTLDVINLANRSSFAFAGGCESGGGVVSFALSATATVNGTAPCVSAGYAATGLDLATLADGTVNLSVTQADPVGNATTTTGSTVKDTVNPLLTIDTPPDILPANQASYLVLGTCSEAGRAVNVTIGGLAAPATCGTPGAGLFQATRDVSSLADGSVAVSATHNDAAGNTASANATANKVNVQAIPRLVNISTRGQVRTGAEVMIAGFIIGGTMPKTVAVTVAGPSLIPAGIPNALANPTLLLVRSSDGAVIGNNDNWQQAANAAAIQAAGFAPAHPNEPAVMMTLAPGAYTAIVQSAGGTPGVGLVGVYEVDRPEVPLINISTRGFVGTDADVMIAGLIIQGNNTQSVVITVAGPSLVPAGIPNALMNPTLIIVRASDGAVVATNDNWQSQANPGDVALIQNAGFAPAHPNEPAVYLTLPPGAYTAIVVGAGGGTGVGLVGVYKVF